MKFPVLWHGETIGDVTVAEMPQAVEFTVNCKLVSDTLLRCYGQTNQGPLLLGVMEPIGNRLFCHKKISRQSLQEYDNKIPKQYYLGISGEMAYKESSIPVEPIVSQLWTGEPMLDCLLADGTITAKETPVGLQLSCPFIPGTKFPLACVAPVCRVVLVKERPFAVFTLHNAFYKTISAKKESKS